MRQKEDTMRMKEGCLDEMPLLRIDGKPGAGFPPGQRRKIDPATPRMRKLRKAVYHLRNGGSETPHGDQEGWKPGGIQTGEGASRADSGMRKAGRAPGEAGAAGGPDRAAAAGAGTVGGALPGDR